MTPHHQLSEIDPERLQAICSLCGPVAITRIRHGAYGRCRIHGAALGRRSEQRVRARKLAGAVCNRCGFVPVSLRQLEVHHRDRNRQNNDPTNLEALCANCHVLEHAAPDLEAVRPAKPPPPAEPVGALFRLPFAVHARVTELARAQVRWSVNAELHTAVEHWLQLPPEEQQAARALLIQRRAAERRLQTRRERSKAPATRTEAREWIASPEE